MAEDGIYRRTQVPVKVIRGRGCNESFRAAVDRSYDAPTHHIMEPGLHLKVFFWNFIIEYFN